MRLPALWVAVAFASGIAAGRFAGGIPLWMTVCLGAIAVGMPIVIFTKRMALAGALALLAWFALGNLGARLELLDIPQDDAARLISRGELRIDEPLRWFGRLREEPEATPIGWRYTIDLQGVEKLGQVMPVRGGLRLTYYRGHNGDAPPVAHAGDIVETLCRVHPPRNFLDPGAFDERGYLARQNIELLGSLRSAELLRVTGHSRISLAERLARARGDLLEQTDRIYSGSPNRIAVLRAMLLGDRNFVNSDLAETFQKTGAFHVLVLAGLHVAALAAFFIWLGRIFRLPLAVTTSMTLLALAIYVGVVQDRPPILRAALMAAIFLWARLLFRRVALVNTVAFAALVLLVARPSELFDSSYQLSFLAAGVIAGLAVPWVERSSSPYRHALEHLGDVTRDRLHSPRATQFRLDLRSSANALAKRLPNRLAPRAASFFTLPVRLGLRVWDLFLLSFCIQLGMLPLMAADFHRVSLSGPVSNIFAVMLTAAIVPLGFATLALSYLSHSIAFVFAKAEGLLVAALLETVRWFGAIPQLSWRVPGPAVLLLLAFIFTLVALAGLAWRRAERSRNEMPHAPKERGKEHFVEWGLLSLVLFLAALVAWHPLKPSLHSGELEATVLDVGQGDSIFIGFPDGRTMLIDGGGLNGAVDTGGYQNGFDVGERVVSPYLWSRGIKRLDVVVLTHAHHDHIDGLRAVLNNFCVGQLWVGRDEDSRAYLNLVQEARARGITIVHQFQGETFNWDGAFGQVFWPVTAAKAPAAANNDSVVLRIGFGTVHFLLPGDAEHQVEDVLTTEHEPLQSDFLKVPHHGSKTSSTEGFLEAVRPRVAVVSVGADNPYGQPNPATVQRYASLGIRLLRTDRDGAVTVLTNGLTVAAHAFAEK